VLHLVDLAVFRRMRYQVYLFSFAAFARVGICHIA